MYVLFLFSAVSNYTYLSPLLLLSLWLPQGLWLTILYLMHSCVLMALTIPIIHCLGNRPSITPLWACTTRKVCEPLFILFDIEGKGNVFILFDYFFLGEPLKWYFTLYSSYIRIGLLGRAGRLMDHGRPWKKKKTPIYRHAWRSICPKLQIQSLSPYKVIMCIYGTDWFQTC